jgi:VIT1/CCC1 family predicted Fe2+/Mn2+ transporter
MPNEKAEVDFLNNIITRWKQYSEITNLGPIARRYFVMNAFDGVLTALGIIMTNFLFQFIWNQTITQSLIITTFISVTLATGISGFVGAFLSETAEMRKTKLEQRRIMVLPSDDDTLGDETIVKLNEEDYYSFEGISENWDDAESILDEDVELDPKPFPIITDESDIQIKKSINQKAETFAFVLLSLTNGISPVIGAFIGLIPFFLSDLTLFTYIISLIIIVIMLFFLGLFLAKISEKSIWKYGMQMILAGVFTAIISTALQLIGV